MIQHTMEHLSTCCATCAQGDHHTLRRTSFRLKIDNQLDQCCLRLIVIKCILNSITIDTFCESTLVQSRNAKCIQLRAQLRLNAIITNLLVKLRLRLRAGC